MIEKLKPEIKELFGGECPIYSSQALLDTVNQLVDAVNATQKERETERFEIQEWIGILEAVRKSVNVHEKQIDELQMKVKPEKCKTSVDPYAEQRKWVGKLCKFRDHDNDEWTYSVLQSIDTDTDVPFWDTEDYEWAMCEPVKPDDDIIYKGEQQ